MNIRAHKRPLLGIVWLASEEAVGVHDERVIAAESERWLRDRKGRGEAG
jgi:hypothetical protein